MDVALAHDYLTQRGGAERVVGMMARAWPQAPIYTTLFDPAGTFPELAELDVRPAALNRWSVLRHHHRLALPLLARTVSGMRVDAEVLVASSSGWAHGIACTGRKIVYCHAPARWLYQADRYVGAERAMGARRRLRRGLERGVLGLVTPPLRRWDRSAAATADRYLVNSTVTRRAVRREYGIEAEVLPPPPALGPDGPERPAAGIDRPFVLCVARLLPYKNVDVVIEAARRAGGPDLVVVGDGPDRQRLLGVAGGDPRIHLLGRVDDAVLRWLYRSSVGLVAASYEDYGLSPLEAAGFGRPTAALHDGGFLDTVADGTTGVFFDRPDADGVAGALDRLTTRSWDETAIRDHAAGFSVDRFVARLRAVVDEERGRA